MRLVQLTIPTGKRQAIVDALDEEGVDYVLTDESSGRDYTAVAHIPLPTNAVEPVLDRLRQAGLDEEAYTVVVEASTVISRRFDQLEAEFATDEDEDRIAREELHSRAEELSPTVSTYVLMSVISAVIATAGLLLDSPATVVGSMVIAPLIGPAMATSVGTVLDDGEMFARGVKLQIAGMLLAVVSAAAFAAFVRYTHLVPPGLDVTAIDEVNERLAPDFLSLAIALGAGVAGAASLAAGVRTAIVGVMIAVALMPPAATVGIGIAWGLPLVSVGSGVLALINGLSINFAAIVVLWQRGYRPSRWLRLDDTRTATLKRVAVLAVAIAVLSVFLGGVTVGTFQSATTENAIESEIDAVLAQPEYDSAILLDTEISFGDNPLVRSPQRVVVTVGLPPDQEVDGLAGRLDDRIDRVAGRDVETVVQYVTTVKG